MNNRKHTKQDNKYCDCDCDSNCDYEYNCNKCKLIVYQYKNTGPTGPIGHQGRPGRDLINGKPGSKGEKGSKGDTGSRGERGIPGQQGKQGLRGFAGPEGREGREGDKGDTGATGARGTHISVGNGIPTNVINYISGDLYIDLDTGIIYQFNDQFYPQIDTNTFEDFDETFNEENEENEVHIPFIIVGSINYNGIGSIGPTGHIGPTGLNGSIGLNGIDGSTGPAGIDGSTGSTGSTGSAGIDGSIGPTGLSGIRGPLITSGSGIPSDTSNYMDNDLYLDTKTSNLYKYYAQSNIFTLISNLGTKDPIDSETSFIHFNLFNKGDTQNTINNYYSNICQFTVNRNDDNDFPLMIFDTSNPNANTELGSPNINFDGPGIGIGGQQGKPGENNKQLDKILVISDDNDINIPKEANNGGKINIIFIEQVIVSFVKFIYGDNNQILIETFNENDILLNTYMCPILNQNSVHVQQIYDNNVKKMSISSIGKFGINLIGYKDFVVNEDVNITKYFLAHHTNELEISTIGITIPWNKTEISSNIYTFDNDQIIINEDAYYKIFIDIVVYQTNSVGSSINSCEAFIIKKNQYTNNYYTLDGTRGSMTLNDLLHGYATCTIHTIKKFKKGDIIKVKIIKNGPNSNISTYSHGCRILIENLNY